jgi:hypothetical protein
MLLILTLKALLKALCGSYVQKSIEILTYSGLKQQLRQEVQHPAKNRRHPNSRHPIKQKGRVTSNRCAPK